MLPRLAHEEWARKSTAACRLWRAEFPKTKPVPYKGCCEFGGSMARRKSGMLKSPSSFLRTKERRVIRSYKGVKPTIPGTCYVDESAQIIGDVVLGEHASVWMNAVLRGDVHEIRIGAHSNVQDNSVLHGMKQQWGVYLGEYVTVGHSVTLHGCVIEDRCLIGMGSIILNGARIGAGSIIAAGTLIPEKTVVEPGSLWMGSPGKFKRKLGPAEEESIMRYARNYLGYKDEYLKERA
jgi:carbonic anhydrase/acetyltransferase-like protein (isoleucine patch superfamily)